MTNQGWQIESWKLAQAQKHFEIEGCTTTHGTFTKQLLSAFRYSAKIHPTKIEFIPPSDLN
jgi:hypothetical protein